MSLDSYDGLKTEIASYLARSDVTANSESVDSFIDLAEAYLNKRLRTIRMQDTATITAATDGPLTDLPTDFLEIYAFEYTSNPKRIDYAPRTSFSLLDGGAATGRPGRFTLAWDSEANTHQVRFIVTPDSAYEFNLVYYTRIPALSSSNQANWLLTDYPEIYLNACLYYAFKRFRSPLAGEYKALLDADIDGLNGEDERTRGTGGMVQTFAGTAV